MQRLRAEGDGDAAGEQADGGEDGQVEHVLGVGPVQALADVEEVGDHEDPEEGDLGEDQAQDADATAPGAGQGGGGEVVAHSRVQASQGSAPASSPFRSETMTFTTKKSTPMAWRGTPRVVM